jgi:DsbC/DsbD-like thiol-disulfide interchange protein
MSHLMTSTCVTLTCLLALTCAAVAAPKGTDLVKAQLLADVSAIKPGEPFHIGVLLKIEPKWHVYWINPGDSGQATEVQFTAPAGFQVGELRFPVPKQFMQTGDIVGYGYEDQVMLWATVTAPATLDTREVKIDANVSWLVCEAICLPGSTDVSLTLPVSDNIAPANQKQFDEWHRRTPNAPDKSPAVKRVVHSVTSSNPDGQAHVISVIWAKSVPQDVQWFPPAGDAFTIEDATIVSGSDKLPQTTVTFTVRPLKGQTIESRTYPSVIAYTDESGNRRGVDVGVSITNNP